MNIGIQSAATVNEIGIEKAYKFFAEAGFKTIDWNLDSALPMKAIMADKYKGNCIFEKELDQIIKYYEEELNVIKNNGLSISQVHAPFPCFVIGDESVLDYMIEIYKKMILFCDVIKCKNIIIHGISLSKKDKSNTIKSIRNLNDKLYISLISTLVKTNVTVCLENLFTGIGGLATGVCANPYEAVEMIDRYNNIAQKECFGLCLDMGHLNLLRQDCRNYIPILGRRIKALHLHDNDGFSDQHKAPYTGTIDWKSFCTEMAKINYCGDISFETYMQTSLSVIDEELLMPWLSMIYKIGEHFKSKIQSKNS